MTTKYSIFDVWNDLSELQATCFTVNEKDIVIRKIMKKIEKSKLWEEKERKEIIIDNLTDSIDKIIKTLKSVRRKL